MRPSQQPMQYCSSFEGDICLWSSCSSITLLDQQSLSQAWIECGNTNIIGPPSHRLYRQGISCHRYAIFNTQNDKKDIIRLPCAQLIEPITTGVIVQLRYSCVHNQIASCGLFRRQSVTLTIGLTSGCSHNQDKRKSGQTGKCASGQALI